MLKIIPFIKYTVSAISYGVLFAVILIMLLPNLKLNQLFNPLSDQQPHPTQALSYAKAVSIASPAVVNIYSENIIPQNAYASKASISTRLGSGVIMDSNGYILTNLHVIENADLIKVVLQSGRLFSAELIGFDKVTDLAVLKVNAIDLPVIPQQKDLESLAGDVVLAIGNPLNLGQTVTQGIVSATGRSGLSSGYLDFLQMDAAINQGNSGGALINSNGILVGINSRKFTQSNPAMNIQGIFFAVPYQLANKIMRKLITHGTVIRGWLGISSDSESLSAKGFVIESITPNSPAELGGLQQGDVVYKIGDENIKSLSQALDIIAETTPNTQLSFSLYRKGKPLKLNVTIGQLNI
ncbi:MAG: trypsin-like peptidase domain-containing protein [Colwellia sp.]